MKHSDCDEGEEIRSLSMHGFFKDRVVELSSGDKVLLPASCSSETDIYTPDMLNVVFRDDSEECSILVTGETGTGKEAFFKCVTHFSARKSKICELNCAGLSETLIDTELFGYGKGVFSGQNPKGKNGLLTSCADGILYLDEIGWMSKTTQAKLLRFMETGECRRIGEYKSKRVKNVRIIAATNADVKEKLLPDLIYRFAHHIHLPPLRKRGADVFWFLEQKGFLGYQHVYTGISLRTIIAILNSEWKGNVRELAKYCRKKVVFRDCKSGPETGNEFILDDESLGESAGLIKWMIFAGEVLKYIYEQWDASDDDTPDIESYFLERKDTAFLGLLHQIAHFSTRDSGYYSAGIVVPIGHILECLFHGKSTWFLEDIIQACKDKLDVDVFSTGAADIGSLLIELKEIITKIPEEQIKLTYSIVHPNFTEWQSLLEKEETIQKLLAMKIEPPNIEFDELLRKHKISGDVQKMCHLCKQGKSASEIERILKVPKSTIKSKLAKVRRDCKETIAPLIPAAPGGRRPSIPASKTSVKPAVAKQVPAVNRGPRPKVSGLPSKE